MFYGVMGLSSMILMIQATISNVYINLLKHMCVLQQIIMLQQSTSLVWVAFNLSTWNVATWSTFQKLRFVTNKNACSYCRTVTPNSGESTRSSFQITPTLESMRIPKSHRIRAPKYIHLEILPWPKQSNLASTLIQFWY